jgi:hypothetical protein
VIWAEFMLLSAHSNPIEGQYGLDCQQELLNVEMSSYTWLRHVTAIFMFSIFNFLQALAQWILIIPLPNRLLMHSLRN